MPRVYTKKKSKAGKPYTCNKCGKPINPGETYYHWQFRNGPLMRQCAKTCGYPRRGQLTNSKMGAVYDAVDGVNLEMCEHTDDIKSALQEVASVAREVGQEYGESADNMESAFPGGSPTMEACREASEALESWADSLESWEPDYAEWDYAKEHFDDEDEWLDAERGEAQSLIDEQPEYQG